ncbi:MAG: thioredoxin-dependent thiol peroxidase [Theionarchaea archaeon]|nr:thioredoxin-dependent thiol peroxidase [Theionarchaea archaeon]
MLQIGKKAPDFCLPDKNEDMICLKDYEGRWVVLYFYPKDNTKGCTLEAMDFNKALSDFQKLNAVVVGISPDSPRSHTKFADDHDLEVILLSDPDHAVLEKYGVWQLKKMYGREYEGVVRSTFLIDPQGDIAYNWKKVRVPNHVNTVTETLKELQTI